eukprot:513115-Pleurochrysis_carterae.AAC.1
MQAQAAQGRKIRAMHRAKQSESSRVRFRGKRRVGTRARKHARTHTLNSPIIAERSEMKVSLPE